MSSSPSFRCALSDLQALVSDELQQMHSLFQDASGSSLHHIATVINHLVLAGGKRVRPLLLLACCKMLGCKDERRIKVASAIEFIHCATLLHDDVVDESTLRRGVKTSNAIWGNKTSILVGDFLLAVAFQWVAACGSLPIVSVLSDASSVMITGEVQQMVYSKDPNITLSKYLEIISAKTAALFSAACEASAILHDAPDAHRHALKYFGYNFGLAFQILDDILDYTATKGELGKDPGKDLLDKKFTLPLIITYDSLGANERNTLRDLLSSSDNIDFHVIYRYMESCDAIERSRKFALEYADKALSHLHTLPDSECRSKLAQFLHSATQRSC